MIIFIQKEKLLLIKTLFKNLNVSEVSPLNIAPQSTIPGQSMSNKIEKSSKIGQV